MRHLSAEPGLPREQSTGLSQQQQEEDEEEEEGEEEEEEERQQQQQQQQQPWKRHGLQMGCSPPEPGAQKVYQVSIFSPRGSGSAPPQQRGPRRQPIKRACPEPRWVAEGGEWEAKRGHWGTEGQEEEEEEAIEDGLLVDGLALGGAGQHFSHSGLRVVEHRPEVSPSQRGGREPGAPEGRGAALPAPGRRCATLHTRDSAPALRGEQPAMEPRPEENGAPRFPHGHDLHSPAPPSPPPGQPPQPPNTPPEAPSLSSANGLCSAEKTPCSSGQLCGGGPASCPAKRKLLPSVEGRAATGLEDESLLPARKKRALQSPTVPASCRSTDAKGAPFWNHLLPAAKGAASGRTGASQLKPGLHLKPRRRQLRSSPGRALLGRRPPSTSTSHALLGNFEESMLKGRFPPSGRIEGFTAEIGASGSYCPQHATLPVEVTYFDIAEHNAPSPFLGVIDLEALGKKGYSIPRTGTIQVTLFNPNKTVVKMFLVTYDFHDMPANHLTFLRHRIFLVPVGEGEAPSLDLAGQPPKRVLCYLMHLRFHSSKSGKIYLHDNIRLLFSRKSIEMDSGIPYELKSFTELPRNPCYSPRA